MKRAAIIVVFGVLLTALTPGTAQAWVQVDRDVGRGRAVAAGWTENYREIWFYGGHSTGQGEPFSATWKVLCDGGFSFYAHDTVSDTDTKYWGDTVRIPRDQGRCRERLAVRHYGRRMTAVIEAR